MPAVFFRKLDAQLIKHSDKTFIEALIGADAL
jgi:hypothetical protein